MRYRIPVFNNGDQRTIKRFLLFPRIIQYELRWLEMATIQQEFVVWGYLQWQEKWSDVAWVDEVQL
jgi:hypothetical protein